MPEPSPEILFNPYPGLRSFRSDEDYLFFGREEQTAELLRRLGRNRFVAVVGTSGSGKSSLVRCGLLSELQGGGMVGAGSHWKIAVMHPGGDPLRHLAEALLAADLYDRDDPEGLDRVMATLRRSDAGLVEAARQAELPAGANLLLVVDQFEEIFRFHDAARDGAEEAPDFVRLLLEAARNDLLPIYVVLTMRSDFLGDCSRFAGLAEAVNDGEYLIPRLNRDQTRSAIEGPALVAGGEIRWRLLVRLLNDLEEQADRLPVLQHCLMRLWGIWARDHGPDEPLDLRHYEAIGGMAEALSLHADEIYASLPGDAARAASAKLFKALTEKGADNRGVRRPARLERLVATAGGETIRDDVLAVIHAFRAPGVTFLVPGEETGLLPGTVIDISHESLMRVWRRLREWVDEEAQSVRIYRRLMESAELWKDGRAGLYHDPDLQIARSWREAEQPTAEWGRQNGGGFAMAMEFLEASGDAVEAEDREREAARARELEHAKALTEAQRLRVAEQVAAGRKLKRLLAVAASVAVIAAMASVFAAVQRVRARNSEHAAQGLAAQLKTQLVRGDLDQATVRLAADDPATGLAHLARAMRTDPDSSVAGLRALSALSSGLFPNRRFPPIEHRKPISLFLPNTESDLLLTSSGAGSEVAVWDLQTGTRKYTLARGCAVVPMSPISGEPAPSDFSVPELSDEAMREARWVLHASDPPVDPGLGRRYYRKTIPLGEFGPIAKAEIFLRVDDAFTLSVNGTKIGGGKKWDLFHYADLTGAAGETKALVLDIDARNTLGGAGVVGIVRVTGADGKVHLVSSGASWQSSTSADGPFTDTQVLGALGEWNNSPDPAVGRVAVTNPRWSADSKRLIALRQPDNRIRAWDTVAGGLTGGSVDATAMDGDFEVSRGGEAGDIVAFGDASGALQLWNLTTGRAVAPPLRTQGRVTEWRFARDGRYLIGLFSDGLIAVWNAADGTPVQEIIVGPVRLDEWTVSPEGTWLAALGNQRTLANFWKLGDPASPAGPEWITLAAAGREKPLATVVARTIQFLPGESLLSITGLGVVGETSHFLAWSYDCPTRESRLAADLGEVTADFNDMGQLAPGTTSSHPWEVDPKEGIITYSIRHGAGDTDRAFGLAGAVQDTRVTVWDLRTGEQLARLVAPEPLETANLAPDGRTLIAGSRVPKIAPTAGAAEKRLYVFDLATGQLALPKPIVLPGRSYLAYTPDGETMVTYGAANDAARFWDVRTGRQVRSPVMGNGFSHCLFSKAGDRAALFSYQVTSRGNESLGQNLGLFSLQQTGLPPAIPESLTPTGRSPFVLASPRDRQWLTFLRPTAGAGAQIQIWDAGTNRLLRAADLEIAEGTSNFVPAWSGDGGRLAYKMWNGDRTDSALLFDVTTGHREQAIRMDAYINVVALSPDGKVMAIGATDGEVKTWSPSHGEIRFFPFAQHDSISVLVFSGDGSLLLIGDSKNRNVAVVDAATGRVRFGPRSLTNPVEAAVFVPDGKHVVISALDRRVLVVDLQAGDTSRELVIDDWSRGLDLSPDGRTLAMGSGGTTDSASGRAYLWDVSTWAPRTAPLALNGSTRSVKFGADGTVLATGTFQTATGFGYLQLWDVATGLPLTTPFPGRGDVSSIAFQDDGSAVAAAWADGVIRTIPLPRRDSVPSWMPDVAEAAAGMRLGPESGAVEPVPDAALEAARVRFTGGSKDAVGDDTWSRWVHWMFEDSATRPLSPGATTTVGEYVRRLRRSDDVSDLREALRIAPNDGLTTAWLALRSAAIVPAQAHWADTVVRISDRATALEPRNAEVWALRAALLQRVGRAAAAEAAARRAVELSATTPEPKSPHPDYVMALVLAAKGDVEGADAAFARALVALAPWSLRPGQTDEAMLGALQRLKPAAALAGTPRRDLRLPEPIPGTFEDFDTVSEGSLPSGWSVWNNSADSVNALSRSLNDRQSSAFKDWLVLSRDRFVAAGFDVEPRLWSPVNHSVNGRAVQLLAGNFAVAQSDTRRGRQIQHLFTPDFDCRDRQGIHVAFHSVFTQNEDAIAALEVSIDQGATWHPVLYRLEEGDVVKAPNGSIDAVATFSRVQRDTPRYRDADGGIRGDRFGDFIAAKVTPELGAFVEPGRNDDRRQFNRVEVLRVAVADDQPRVRFRFAQAGSSSWSWIIDAFGLYAVPSGPTQVAGAEVAAPPPDGDQLAGTAEALLREGPSASEAIDALLLARRAVTLLPGQARALHVQAKVLRAMAARDPKDGAAAGMLAEAHTAIGQAIALRPAVRGYWETMGRIHLQLAHRKLGEGDRAEAAVLLESAQAIFSGSGLRDTSVQEQIGAGLVTAGRMSAPQPLVPRPLEPSARWRFLDNGSDQGTAWREPEFDDRGWKEGPGPLGFGNDGEVTKTASGPTDGKFVTTYFRTAFTTPVADAFNQLELQLKRDDGAVVHLNGVQIARSNMPAGDIRFDTLAVETVNDDKEGKWERILVPADSLRSGRNVLAVEIHQVNRTSSDLGFDLRLNGIGPAADKIPAAAELDALEAALKIPVEVRPTLWAARSRLFRETDLVDRAEEARQHALAIDPEDTTAWWLTAQSAAMTGDSGTANAGYRRALAAALALANRPLDSRRLFLPPGFHEFGNLAEATPLAVARAGVRRSQEADADRRWELPLLDRWLADAAPDDPDVLRERVVILTAAGEFARAGEILDQLEARVPAEPGRDAIAIRIHRERLTLRENLLRGMGRADEADAIKKQILSAPPRDPRLDAKLLDLTDYYNASLYDARGWDNPSLNLASLPESFQVRDGVAFDLRGIIQLDGSNMSRTLALPDRVEGIRVGAAAAAVHFLLSTLREATPEPGSEVARVVFHYADGTSAVLPLVDQENICDFWIYGNQTIDPEKIAWIGDNTGSNAEPMQLLHAVWRNPHPERRIATLDLVSAMKRAAPFVVGITLE